MSGGDYPTATRIAKALVLAAWRMDELSVWIKADEAVLRGDVQIRSRWIALAVLAALHPRADVDVLGLYVGAPDARLGWSVASVSPWWDRRLVEQLLVDVASTDALPWSSSLDYLTRILPPLVGARVTLIKRSGLHAR